MAKQFNIGCGLLNRRRNCFLNATLQTLFHIPKIANCLQREVNGNDCTVRNCVTCGVINLFADTKTSTIACSPYKLYDTLKKANSRFSDLLNGNHQDAHEFLIVLNQELERQPHSADWFSNNFTVNLATHIRCGSCGKIHESFSGIIDIAIHLKSNRSIQAAVDSYFNYDDVDFLCEDCRTHDTVKKKHYILSAPPLLCLQLRRFSEQGTKIKDAIEITGLRLKKHFLKTQTLEWNYKLVAVVNHFGESRNVGHYNTIVLSPDGEHYEFDDRSVRKVSSNLVSGENAYILFYEQVEESPNYDLNAADMTFSMDDNNLDEDCGSTTEFDNRNEFQTNLQNRFEMDQNLFVENGVSPVDQSQNMPNSNSVNQNTHKISGRRIVDIDYFFNQMTQLTDFMCRKCEIGKLVYTDERRSGLQSSFIFSCNNCGNALKFHSSVTYDDTENINTSAVLGTISIGLGNYHLEEFLAHLNVPTMSYATYHKYEEERIQHAYLKLCKQLEDEALAQEIKLAKENNEVDSAGNALISVEFDGSWEKRAYTTKFSSLAGCAAIIGLRTNKILYSGTKQKYCHVCKLAANKSTTTRKHDCKRNYEGPSCGMETEIIVEGFKYCNEKGARFNKFVGDGDSSTYKALRDLQIYKEPVIMIEKFECVNHLFRNFLKQFKAMLKNSKWSVKGRNLLSVEIGRRICKAIRSAAKHWRESDIELAEKYLNLEKDIMNVFLHYLGVHDDCAKYFCQKSTDPDAFNTIKVLKETGIYYTVLDLCQSYFGNNVKSLVAGLTTNKTEGFNSLIAKFIGGKRICNSLAGSYKLRTNAASVQYNTEGQSGSKIHELIFGKSSPIIETMENKRKRKCYKNASDRKNKPKDFVTDEPPTKKYKRKYADGHEDLDMTDSQFDAARTRFLERLREKQVIRLNIENETRGQPHSFKWMEERKFLLTSSYFGRILNVRSRQSYAKIVEEIVYKNSQYSNTADIRHQRIYEKEGLKIFVKLYAFDSVDTCGLFIDEKLPFLGATPMRTVGDNAILIVKCPKKEFGKSIEDATKTISFWTGSHLNRSINKKSHWYYEIQGKLHVTKKNIAYLVIYLGNDVYEVVELERDDEFWNMEMEEELCFFFNEALIKELIDPREDRSMEVRQYNPKNKTFE